jgi:DNA-binding response OmpR family regulator
MPVNSIARSRILLVGLEPKLSSELSLVLLSEGHEVEQANCSAKATELLRITRPHLIFCATDPSCFQPMRRALMGQADLPIVVVSRCPEVTEWLDAIEGGASDYCAAPFEAIQVRWILESNLRRSHSAAA